MQLRRGLPIRPSRPVRHPPPRSSQRSRSVAAPLPVRPASSPAGTTGLSFGAHPGPNSTVIRLSSTANSERDSTSGYRRSPACFARYIGSPSTPGPPHAQSCWSRRSSRGTRRRAARAAPCARPSTATPPATDPAPPPRSTSRSPCAHPPSRSAPPTPAARRPTHRPAPGTSPTRAPPRAAGPFSAAAAQASASGGDDPRVAHGVLLLKAAGVASAELVAHRDTWGWLAALAVDHSHFRTPPSVEDIKEGRVQTVLSGRSLIALLIELWNTRSTATPLQGDWALAMTTYNRIAAELTDVAGQDETIRIILDDDLPHDTND